MEKESSRSGSGATSERRSRPKRGAIPTPKEEIERAKPFISESDPASDQPTTGPASPTQTNEEQKGRQSS